MGVLDKLFFWRRRDELDFDELTDKELRSDEEEGLGGLKSKSRRGLKSGLNENDSLSDLGSDALESDADLDSLSGDDLLSRPNSPTSFQKMRGSQNNQNNQNVPSPFVSKDLELINSKLDTLKAMLDSISQRMTQIEQVKNESDKKYERQKLW